MEVIDGDDEFWGNVNTENLMKEVEQVGNRVVLPFLPVEECISAEGVGSAEPDVPEVVAHFRLSFLLLGAM